MVTVFGEAGLHQLADCCQLSLRTLTPRRTPSVAWANTSVRDRRPFDGGVLTRGGSGLDGDGHNHLVGEGGRCTQTL